MYVFFLSICLSVYLPIAVGYNCKINIKQIWWKGQGGEVWMMRQKCMNKLGTHERERERERERDIVCASARWFLYFCVCVCVCVYVLARASVFPSICESVSVFTFFIPIYLYQLLVRCICFFFLRIASRQQVKRTMWSRLRRNN